jgi:hypothetical protein
LKISEMSAARMNGMWEVAGVVEDGLQPEA